MKRILALLFIFSFIFSYTATALYQVNTVYGDCQSQDASKQYKSKTYIDQDGDGKWDVVKTFWCNDKNSTSPYKKSIVILPPIEELDHRLVQYNEVGENKSFIFELYDYINNDLVAIETKLIDNDTVFCTDPIVIPIINYDNIEPILNVTVVKQETLNIQAKFEKVGVIRIQLIYYNDSGGNDIRKEFLYTINQSGLNTISLDISDLPNGNYYVSLIYGHENSIGTNFIK